MSFNDKYEKHERVVLDSCKKLSVPVVRSEVYFIDPQGKRHGTEGVVHYSFGMFLDVYDYVNEPMVDVYCQWQQTKHHNGCGLSEDLTFDECIDKFNGACKDGRVDMWECQTYIKKAFCNAVKLAGVVSVSRYDRIEQQLLDMELNFNKMIKELKSLRKQVRFMKTVN